MTKQEKIKQAYGDYFEDCKPDTNGWFNINNSSIKFQYWFLISDFDKNEQDHNQRGEWYRPKSLQGIEDNNGWIKIESEAYLPKEYEFYNACAYDEKHKNDVPIFYGCNLPDLRNYFDEGVITHYQPIKTLKNPLY